MDTLTVVKLFSTTSISGSVIWTFEIPERKERFESFSSDPFAAFADHAIQKELENQLLVLNDSEVDFSTPDLKLNIDCPYVPEEPMPRSERDEQVEKVLIGAYCDVLIDDICELVNKNCEACEIFDPSQDHHDCLMMTKDTKVYRYLKEALSAVDQDKVMNTFVQNIETLTPKVNALELLKYQCQDSRREIIERRMSELETIFNRKHV